MEVAQPGSKNRKKRRRAALGLAKRLEPKLLPLLLALREGSLYQWQPESARGAGLAGGCTRLTGPGALVRWLADSPEVLRKTHFEIWDIARKTLFGREATPFRKF